MGPAGVDGDGEDEVAPEEPEFGLGGDGGEAERWGVADGGADDERDEEVGPHWEGLVGEMGEDDLGGHAAEDEGEGDAEKDEVVVGEKVGVWRGEPGDAGDGEGEDWEPLEEDWEDWEVLSATGLDDVDDAGVVLVGMVGGREWGYQSGKWAKKKAPPMSGTQRSMAVRSLKSHSLPRALTIG